jgi:hypothetical protein
MKPSSQLRHLTIATVVMLSAGCGSIQVAEKNLEEGRLVPEAAIATPDFLNEYRHPLSPPRQALAGLDIALEQRNVLAQGGKLLAQIGISTAPPALKPVSVHALVFAPADPGQNEVTQITNAVSAIRGCLRELPGGMLTVDLIRPVKGLSVAEPSLLRASTSGNLKDFLTAYARQSFDDGEHHLILLVGSDKAFLEPTGLGARERQDIVDLGRILAAKSVTLSVLSVGDKPDFAFLKKLSETGSGTFNVATESLDYEAWIRQELRARSAEILTHVELAVTAKNGARLVRVLAPRTLRHTAHNATFALSELRQGEQRVLLAELEIPARNQQPTNEVLDVGLTYYVPAAKRYYNARQTLTIQYVDDRNLALRASEAVKRSLLILETQETLQSVAREIRNRRNYQAIALLTRQSRALKQTGEKLKDRELLRDATILAKYADRLYDFDGEWFKSVKIWRDLSWDTERFRNMYR